MLGVASLLRESPHFRYRMPCTERRVELQEKEMIESALAESRGRVYGLMGAAAKLRIRTLDSKIKRVGINKFRFKRPQAS